MDNANASAWIELKHDENTGRMTCELPEDQDEIEVRLEDGSFRPALFCKLGYEEWGFTDLPTKANMFDWPNEIENVVAWRYPEQQPLPAPPEVE